MEGVQYLRLLAHWLVHGTHGDPDDQRLPILEQTAMVAR